MIVWDFRFLSWFSFCSNSRFFLFPVLFGGYAIIVYYEDGFFFAPCCLSLPI